MTDPAAPDLAIVERLNALADRCEAAAGPDWEIDEEISAAIADAVREVQPDGHTAFHTADGSRWISVSVRPYTAPLDAAMTLVPERLDFGCGSRDATGTAWAWVGLFDGPDFIANAATPALALCAASLRALAKVRGR